MRKELIVNIIVSVCRIGFAYGIILLFTAEVNLLIWSVGAKVWFLVIALLLLSNE
jgi:hypothetical protein